MRNYIAADVDEYIASVEAVAQPTLQEIRRVIKSAVPEVEEKISWGVPFYRYYGLLAGFSVFTNHASFGLAFVLDSDVRAKLEEKGYKTGSKTVQIRFDQKVPTAEIKKLVIAKAKLNRANKN